MDLRQLGQLALDQREQLLLDWGHNHRQQGTHGCGSEDDDRQDSHHNNHLLVVYKDDNRLLSEM